MDSSPEFPEILFQIIEIIALLSLPGLLVLVISVWHTQSRRQALLRLLVARDPGRALKTTATILHRRLELFLGTSINPFTQPNFKLRNFFKPYLEHYILFYAVFGTGVMLAFKPVEAPVAKISTIYLTISYFSLMFINVACDIVSVFWTKRCLENIMRASPRNHVLMGKNLVKDLFVAVLMFSITQTASNALYAVQTGVPGNFLQYAMTPSIALKEYAIFRGDGTPVASLPGQLLISFTTYVPSFLLYLGLLIIVLLSVIYRCSVFKLWMRITPPSDASANVSAIGYWLSALGVVLSIIFIWITVARNLFF